jgi:large subunit ribosomal protein L20
MARVKTTASRKHRKTLKEAKGFGQARRIRIQAAKEALLHAGQYAYEGRRLKKRDLRRLWITRLGAAARQNGISYNELISGLKKAKITLNRKVLADIAAIDPFTFSKIVSEIK